MQPVDQASMIKRMVRVPSHGDFNNRTFFLVSREEIASGGTSLIYRSTYSDSQKEVEKILLPKFHEKASYENLLRREFEILSILDHPLIIKPLRVSREKIWNAEVDVLTLEYIEGVPLSDFSDFIHHLPSDQRAMWAQEVFYQLASALNHLSERNVIHGDLAPDNVLVQSNGFVKLIDFGVARRISDPSLPFRVEGRKRFRAPESRIDGGTSHAADIFAAGKIFEFLLGETLSETEEFRSILSRLLEARELPRTPGSFRGLKLLPENAFFRIKARVSIKTKLTPHTYSDSYFRPGTQLARLGLLALAFPFICSFLPQKTDLTVNTWPYSHFTVSRMDRSIRYETPILLMEIPSGDMDLEFVVPLLDNKRITRRIHATPGGHVKLFEDFRNIDNLNK
jgi:serine/threonine protein kinase